MDTQLVYLIGMLVCLALSAFFSASETAFTSFNKTRMKTLAAGGNRRARLALEMQESYDKLLSTILIGNNIVNITLSTLGTLFFVDILTGTSAQASSAVISTAVITVAVLIFGEISPKSIAKEHAEGLAMAVATPLNLLGVLLTPINALFMLWKKLLSLIFHTAVEDTVTESEVLTLIDEAHEDGSIDEYNKQLIENIFDFDDMTALKASTHRRDVIMLAHDADMEEWKEIILNSHFSRYPIYGENEDDIVGILDARIFLRLQSGDKEVVLEKAVRPAYFVPESVKLDVLFRNMKQAKEHFAMVLDEHGGTSGVVTLTDLVECLVGEYHDTAASSEPEFVQVEERLWQVRGDSLIEDVNKMLGIAIDETDAMTISGYILGLKGIIPEDGATFEVETDALILRVLSSKNRTVERAEIYIKPDKSDEEDEAPEQAPDPTEA